MKKHVPALLGTSLIVAFCVIWLKRFFDITSWSVNYELITNNVFCFIYLVWQIFELRVSLREKADKYADYGTRELYGASQSATILLALWFASPEKRPLALLISSGFLLLAGIFVRAWAIRTLGQYYSHSVRTLHGHKIIDTGPYHFLRHPAYCGMLLAHAGVVAFFFSIPALIAYVFGLVLTVVLRILVEERMLIKLDGYADFALSRKRLVPKIW